MITGRVVPTAISGGAPRAQRIPGVDSSPPPIPKAPDAAPDANPISAATSVRTVARSPRACHLGNALEDLFVGAVRRAPCGVVQRHETHLLDLVVVSRDVTRKRPHEVEVHGLLVAHL